MERKECLTQFKLAVNQLSAVARVGRTILTTYGSTMGELERAGVLDELLRLEERGGQLYRGVLAHANFLLGGREGVKQIEDKIIDAIVATGTLSRGQMGVLKLVDDIARGYAFDTHYYPVDELERMLAALEAVVRTQ